MASVIGLYWLIDRQTDRQDSPCISHTLQELSGIPELMVTVAILTVISDKATNKTRWDFAFHD